MSVLTYAIDPGTKESGVATYNAQGQLIDLRMMDFVTLWYHMVKHPGVYVVEDVKANKFIYDRNQKQNRRVENQVARSVGMVTATQIHITAFLNHLDRRLVLVAPKGGNWGTISPKQGIKALETATGWKKRTNKDTRSAAYLGYWYLRSQHRAAKQEAKDWTW